MCQHIKKKKTPCVGHRFSNKKKPKLCRPSSRTLLSFDCNSMIIYLLRYLFMQIKKHLIVSILLHSLIPLQIIIIKIINVRVENEEVKWKEKKETT